jgi:hypothetical protein
MTDFRILRQGAAAGLKFASEVVDTHVVSNVAHAAATRTTGVTNPLYVLSTGALNTGIFRPALLEKTASSVVRGTGSSAFDDAVRALHQLGSRHGADGISLAGDANLYGAIKFADTSLYMSGKPVVERIGREAAFELDAAARRVLDFVPTPG